MEQVIKWAEKEEEMFYKWLSNEKKEWERLEYRDQKRIKWGLQDGKTMSIWQSDMYKKLQHWAQDYDYFFIYVFQSEVSNYYFVDVGYEDFDFRISFDLWQNKGSVEMYFKHKSNEEYGKPGDYPSLKGEEKIILKEFAISVFSFYEEIKKTIQNEPSNRLRFLIHNFKLDEYFINQMKEEMASKS